jgi:hypothetical protein
LTVVAMDLQSPKIELTKTTVSVQGNSDKDGAQYKLELELFDEIDVEV